MSEPNPMDKALADAAAALCRANGWRVGDTLEGYETWPESGRRHGSRIRLTAIGEDDILAREVAVDDGHGWSPVVRTEVNWSLGWREWRRADDGAAAEMSDPDPAPAADVAAIDAEVS